MSDDRPMPGDTPHARSLAQPAPEIPEDLFSLSDPLSPWFLRSPRDAPSYFAHEPGAQLPPIGSDPSSPQTSPGLTQTPLTGKAFTFRHFPADNADPAREPFATNPTAPSISIPRSTTYPRQSPISEPPTPMIPQEDPARAVPGSPSITLGGPIARAQRPHSALGVESRLSFDDLFEEENRGRPASPRANFRFAASGLTHLGPVLNPFEHTGASTPQSTSSRDHSQRSARSIPTHSLWSQAPQGAQRQAKIVSPEESDGEISSAASSFSVSTRSSEYSRGPIITTRFEHREDENGHHVLIGREGKLTRCEDEPIRVPGAVQGFGVLMVLLDDRTTGKLPVRQVSENSNVILGLTPKYLFSLDCFTATLPPSQADHFWDGLQVLVEPDSDSDEEDENPQVFLVSGWGEPGSAVARNGDEHQRREWTCWVAVHRLKPQPRNGGEDVRRLIVVEFELEHDTFNPLYPPAGSSIASESASAATTSSSGSSTDKPTESFRTNRPTSTPNPASASASSDECTPNAHTANQAGTQLSALNMGQLNLSSGLEGDETWVPSAEAILESTTSRSKPLRALERMRRFSRSEGQGRRAQNVGTMDVFTVLSQANEQLSKALDLTQLLDTVVGIIKDLTQFHRVLVYQFDEAWNGQTVAELVDWHWSHDLYKGLYFPASDIPAQARELYVINRVRLLYNRAQTTARLVVRDQSDLDPSLDMTHCFIRAMSPIHVKYLANMGVRASMSISIVAFNKLWGLVTCHSYGEHGMRVSFPVRQMLRLLSDSISRNVERLSYAQRLRTRKLISTVPTDQHPTGYIVSNAEDLLSLFDADCGVLVIGEGAKILGPKEHGPDILLVAEYLRIKQFTLLQVSQCVTQDYPDLQLPSGLDVISGILYIPISITGQDFMALLRKGEVRRVHWAGRPYKDPNDTNSSFEPRKSFKIWSESIAGRCRAWTDEQLDTGAILALVYGKFIEVWRQKESALQSNEVANILLSNASHEVRTPLHQIINYLELALDGKMLDPETRENLGRSHAASKSLLFTINDLLDLTRLEAGKEMAFHEPFDLHKTLHEATYVYQLEAVRRGLVFKVDHGETPRYVVGDARKIKAAVSNLTANAVKYTAQGSVTVTAHVFDEPYGLRAEGYVAIEIVVSDTGCGIPPEKLESIFRDIEQVDSSAHPKPGSKPGLGLGLAVVARIVEQLGGQLRVDSRVGDGSRFSFLLPFPVADPNAFHSRGAAGISLEDGSTSGGSSEIDSIVSAISTSHMFPHAPSASPRSVPRRPRPRTVRPPSEGKFQVEDSAFPVRPLKVNETELEPPVISIQKWQQEARAHRISSKPLHSSIQRSHPLRILIVEDDPINAKVLQKRLKSDGHQVAHATNGQEAIDVISADREFDCVLMDIQMPIKDGFQATQCIREFEATNPPQSHSRHTVATNGRIPIFAVSASLEPAQREYVESLGMDGWILKPIDFKRMNVILKGISNPEHRRQEAWEPGFSWESGGWLLASPTPLLPRLAKKRQQT